MKNFSFQNKFAHWVWARINHYDHNKYWKRRSIITDPNDKTFFFINLHKAQIQVDLGPPQKL